MLVMAGQVFAAGSCTQAYTGVMDAETRQIIEKQLTFICTGDVTTGAIPATAVSATNLYLVQGWYLFSAETFTTTATNLYDITVIDAAGVDVAGGALIDRTSAAAQDVKYINWPVKATGFTHTIANNSVGAAVIKTIYTFVR